MRSLNARTNAPPVLDVRREAEYCARHRCGAVNIPLEELAARVHELPPPDEPLVVFDVHPTRARWACSRLRARGRTGIACAHGESWLNAAATESGASTGRLWRPHDLLVEALAQARVRWNGLAGRTALDLACGTGRDAVYMALQDMAVRACDLLPDALDRAADLARRSGVALSAAVHDLEAEPRLPPAAFDLVACFHFLHRPLMPQIASAIRPGGMVVYETFLVEQRGRFGKPRRDAHLLRPGELRAWFHGWDLRIDREGLAGPRRVVASLVAFKPA